MDFFVNTELRMSKTYDVMDSKSDTAMDPSTFVCCHGLSSKVNRRFSKNIVKYRLHLTVTIKILNENYVFTEIFR